MPLLIGWEYVMTILMMNSMRTRRGRGGGRGVVWSTSVIANLQLCKSTDVPQLCGEPHTWNPAKSKAI